MHAVYGVLLLATALVLFQFAYIEHRRPVPRDWLRPEIASQMVVFLILAALGTGVGFGIHFGAHYASESLTTLELVAIVAIVALAAARLLFTGRRWRQQRAEAGAARATARELRP